MLGALNGQHDLEQLRLRHARLAAAQARDLDQAGLDQVHEQLNRAEDAVAEVLRPWTKAQAQAARQAALVELESLWESTWGRMTDPAVEARIEEACRQLYSLDNPPPHARKARKS